jgi:hypothetical protein
MYIEQPSCAPSKSPLARALGRLGIGSGWDKPALCRKPNDTSQVGRSGRLEDRFGTALSDPDRDRALSGPDESGCPIRPLSVRILLRSCIGLIIRLPDPLRFL